MYNLANRKYENLLPCRRSNPGPAEPEADMLPSEPVRRAWEVNNSPGIPRHIGTVLVPPSRWSATPSNLSARWNPTTLEHGCSEFPHKILPRLLDWTWQTNLLATKFAGHHSTGLLPLGVCKRPCVCDSSTRSSYLRTRIFDTIATIPMDMLYRTLHKIECRLDIVCATNGAHREVS